MHETLTIRHRRAGEKQPGPAFSGRGHRELSGGNLIAAAAPDGYADTSLAVAGETLAQCIYTSGLFAPPALCSGLGRCGLCRVRFLSEAPPALDQERAVLSLHDLDNAWRLACLHAPAPGMHVLVPAPPVEENSSGTNQPVQAERAAQTGFAVDLGTTSVHWRRVALEEPAPPLETFESSMTNPQMGAGSDVISRLAFAAQKDGAETLRRLITEALARAAKGLPSPPREACVAANPAMTALLLGKETRGLARAPYTLEYAGNTTENVPGLPPVYIPPQISPFIGGDVSAGYASLAFDRERPAPAFPFLLADLGTNGECVLALSGTEALAASLPMGPALEGINLAFGSQAVPGAVTGYALTPYGLEPETLDGAAPVGITGTGYLSLLRALRAANVIDASGLFARSAAMPLTQKINAGTGGQDGEARVRLPGKMALFASDIEEILKVKAAFTVTVSGLLRAADLPAAKLAAVYLAGALGSHAPLAALQELGFLPAAVSGKVAAVGNASLDGAALFLKQRRAREKAAAWSAAAATLNFAAGSEFEKVFAAHMRFSWPA